MQIIQLMSAADEPGADTGINCHDKTKLCLKYLMQIIIINNTKLKAVLAANSQYGKCVDGSSL